MKVESWKLRESGAGDELQAAAARLAEAGVETPVLDAQLILARALGCSRLDLIAHPERVLAASEANSFHGMLARRAERRPLAYILGTKEFFGLELAVGPGVLVPRPETETLVEECLKRVVRDSPIIADIGAGSGAIAVALAASIPSATVHATEISPAALKVARANVEKHQLSGRVKLLEGDLFEPLVALGLEFDAVVANPPYIPTREIEKLLPEISVYEPREALDGGEDGLAAYRRLLGLPLPGRERVGVRVELLKEDAFLALEVGAGQAGAVCRMAESAGYRRTETARDLAGIERVVIAYR